MTPEVRDGIKALLAGHEPDEATTAWLKKQLEHAKWDEDIERMGGGPKARNAYMKPIFDTTCSVTAFDMHAQLMADGRERGLWLWLYDQSKARSERYEAWAEGALEEFCTLAGFGEKSVERFRMSMAMKSFADIAKGKVDEAALLEWPEVKKLYDVIGKQLEAQCPPKKQKRSARKSTSARRARGASTASR